MKEAEPSEADDREMSAEMGNGEKRAREMCTSLMDGGIDPDMDVSSESGDSKPDTSPVRDSDIETEA
jgi:hypothetical protein